MDEIQARIERLCKVVAESEHITIREADEVITEMVMAFCPDEDEDTIREAVTAALDALEA